MSPTCQSLRRRLKGVRGPQHLLLASVSEELDSFSQSCRLKSHPGSIPFDHRVPLEGGQRLGKTLLPYLH